MSKKTIILIGALAVVGVAAFCGTSYYKSKQLEHKEQAIADIENGNYDEAVEELNNNNDDDSAELLELAITCQKMKKSFMENDYEKAKMAADEVKTMKYLNLVTDKIDSVEAETTAKLEEIEMKNLNDKLDALISNNDFEKAEALINEYKAKGINEKLNEINNKIIKAKEEYENAKNKINEKHDVIDKAVEKKETLDKIKDKVEKIKKERENL